jgi:hypothetical protein
MRGVVSICDVDQAEEETPAQSSGKIWNICGRLGAWNISWRQKKKDAFFAANRPRVEIVII